MAAVDVKPAEGSALEGIAEKLRGTVGTNVELNPIRKDTAASIEVTITRERRSVLNFQQRCI